MAGRQATLAILALAALPLCMAVSLSFVDVIYAPWAICETQSAEECAPECSLCTRLDGKQLCFTSATAAKLPAYAFKCTAPGANEEAKPGPWQVCETLTAAECAQQEDRCQLCTRKDGTQLCFEPATAAKLPPFIFSCEGAPPAANPAPAPWEVCETYNPTQCAAHEGRCSLCTRMDGTQLCFEPAVAQKLSPWAFRCTGAARPQPEPTIDGRVNSVWPICEHYDAAACAEHKDTCALCTSLDGEKQLCFSPAVAKKMSPWAFKCKLPATPAASSPRRAGPAGARAAAQPSGKAPWPVCEEYDAGQCADHEERCSLCTRLDGKQLCFTPDIAQALSPWAFKCTAPNPAGTSSSAAAEPAEAAAPWGQHVCEAYGAEGCAAHAGACTLCTRVDGWRMCFTKELAQRLSPYAYHCQEPAALGGPAPWTPCESYNATECVAGAAKDACSLCTSPDGEELCFNPSVATKLPPAFFKCTNLPGPAPPAVPDTELETEPAEPAEPASWTPCESYNATECVTGAAATQCVLCTAPDRDELCFNPTVAAKLPPAVFKCALAEEQ